MRGAHVAKNLVIRIFFRIVMLTSLVACTVETNEISRLPNPAKEIDAVVALRETGATVATPTEIYIVKLLSKIESDPVFRADKIEGLKISWEGNEVVVVHADKARVFLRKPMKDVYIAGEYRRVRINYEILSEE